ncbi:MAG: RNA-binding S4 domain-containing protein [Bacteroidaceae bacterium]|nr:RNA-binding S4 domain-containing protein [Bacteroidaceae bacterium]
MDMEENGNKFYDESGEDRYSRSDENGNGNRREGRPRFVRVDYGNRPQYSKVDRPARRVEDADQGGYGQDRPRRSYSQDRPSYNQDRQQYGQDRPSYGQRQGAYQRQGGYQRQDGGYQRQDGGYQQRQGAYQRQGGYQQRQGGYQQRQGGYNNNGEGSQPRFYRERVQDQNGQQEGGYQQRQGAYQRQGGYQQRQGGYQQRQGAYGQQGGYRKPAQKRQDNRKHIEYHDVIHDPEEEIRLNKYLANAGVCSRREADDFIKAGVVKVNGQTVTELGTKVHRGDNVLFHDQLVSIERKIYILLNKPKDCVTTVDDPQERKTVMDYIKGACKERVYPVGRLDRNTTGVLLLTNDGEMATRLTHPKFLKKKIYHARLDHAVSAEDMQKLLDGVNIGEEDGDIVRADEVSYVNDDKTQVGIEIHSGRNRVVRRMFDALGYRVTRLDRVQFAGLTKKRLRRGDWRFLTEKEVNMLRMGAYE